MMAFCLMDSWEEITFALLHSNTIRRADRFNSIICLLLDNRGKVNGREILDRSYYIPSTSTIPLSSGSGSSNFAWSLRMFCR